MKPKGGGGKPPFPLLFGPITAGSGAAPPKFLPLPFRDRLPYSAADQQGARTKMTTIIRSLSDISDRYDVLYCDLWGCLHNGKALFPEAVAALQAFRRRPSPGGTTCRPCCRR